MFDIVKSLTSETEDEDVYITPQLRI